MSEVEDWKLCDWDGRAAVWRPGCAMAFLNSKWTDVCSADVGNSAKVMTKGNFEAAYPEALPIPGNFDAERRRKLH